MNLHGPRRLPGARASTARKHAPGSEPPGSGGPGEGVYDTIHKAFDWLPLGAVVAGVFVLHGGVGDGSWTIEDLARVSRPLEDINGGVWHCVSQALWSDPSDSDANMHRGVHFNARGADIPLFGPDVTAAFCKKNKIQMIVRSHQFVPEGVKFMHGERLATLFSARNYFEQEENDSALLLIARDEMGKLRVRAKQLLHRVAPRPDCMPLGKWGFGSGGGGGGGGGFGSGSEDGRTVRWAKRARHCTCMLWTLSNFGYLSWLVKTCWCLLAVESCLGEV